MDADQALNVFIKFGVLNQDQAEAAKKVLADVGNETGTLTEKTVANTAKTIEHTAESAKENLSYREKHEVIRGLTTAFPGLREAAMFALNPITLAAFAIGGAFEIWKKRVEEATTALSEVEMPDLTSGIDQANQLAEAWNGIADAIQKAIDKYNSAESVFNRDKQKTDEEAEIKKKLGLGGQTPGQIDEQAQQENLAAKYREQFNAQVAAQTEASAAAAIKLPDSDKTFEAQQAALKERADTLRKTAKEAGTEKDFLSGLGTKGLIENQEDYYEFYEKYGKGQSVEGAMQIQNKRESNASQEAAGVEREIARRDEEKKQRDKLRDAAARDAGTATSIGLEMPDERRKVAEKSAMDLLEPSKSGNETVAQLRAHIAENGRVIRELQQAASELMRTHSGSNQTILDLLKQLKDHSLMIESRLNYTISHNGN